MDLIAEVDRLRADAAACAMAAEYLVQLGQVADAVEFTRRLLERCRAHFQARSMAIVQPDRGEWQVVSAATATRAPLPHELLAEVLDSDSTCQRDSWAATPLVRRDPTEQVLLAQFSKPPATHDLSALDAWAALLGVVRQKLGERLAIDRRQRRLEAILHIASKWNQNLDMESLLAQMAQASTQLLGAQRASIFLWDRAHRALVARPALGVENGELRVPDDRGVVGQVIQTGRSLRIGPADRDQINRQIDELTGFQTQTVLCVPLRGRNEQILGAFEMINKVDGLFSQEDEADLVELAAHAAVALENSQQFHQLLESRKQMARQANEGIQLIGNTPAMRQLQATIRRVAATDLAVLVMGENGTGKEVVSRMVHYLSSRHDEPFIAVNCAALTETLLESELFGHEKGAFTDAHEMRVGKFELAAGGTLFLDEIGDLSPAGQAKLLRVLEEKVVVRVGGSVPIPVDTRVIAATNQNLTELVRARRFREDLFYRLNVVAIELPPLRKRADDVVPLAEFFLRDFSTKARRAPPTLTPQAIQRLRQYSWPGNVRELRNMMERLAYLHPEDTIHADDLVFVAAVREASEPLWLELPLAAATRQFQIEYIRRTIQTSGGNISDAARRMGLHRSNLYRKMRQLGMDADLEDSGSAV